MARTVNPEVHTVRKEAFVDAATRLMQSKGWDRVSVQDVLDQLEASRGAFYHYFDSKQALLEAVIERLVDVGLSTVGPVMDDPTLNANQKLHRVFSTIGAWKTEKKSLVLSLLTVWMSDENAIVRERFRRSLAPRMEPILEPIIRQGVDEGAFRTGSPARTAQVLMILLGGFQEIATQMFLDRGAKRTSLEEVRRTFSAYTNAFERILGAPEGSIQIIDDAVLRAWFG